MTISARPIITKELIYSHITSLDIFQYYCNNFKEIGVHFNSELRQDKNASCQIDWIRGDLMYSDFGDIKGIRAVDYVMLKYNLKYYEALEKIYYNLNLNKYDLGNFKRNNSCSISHNVHYNNELGRQAVLSKPTTIRIKKRNWLQRDKEYWYDKYHISKNTLQKFKISPISHFWIDSRKLDNQMFIADELTYSYDFYWENGVFRRKIYQPEHKGFGKWWSNGGAVVAGEGMLPYSGDLLIISKALKDVMCLYEMKITAIAPTSEENFLPEQYLLKQKKRFKNIILFLDQDETGVKRSKILSEKWNIPYILIPEEYGIKDISDYVHIKGFDAGKKLMKNLLS